MATLGQTKFGYFPVGTPSRSGEGLLAGGAVFRSGGLFQRSMYETVPGRGAFTITTDTFKAIEEWIRWAEHVPHLLPRAMDKLARALALLDMAYAQQYSAGVKRDPYDSARAWQMPVPRVTWAYYLGWTTRRLALGTWLMYNKSREAYFIEYGIHRNPRTGIVAARRIRRPVVKLAFRKVVISTAATAIKHRVWQDIFYPKHGAPGTRAKNLVWHMQSPPVMAQMFPGHATSVMFGAPE